MVSDPKIEYTNRQAKEHQLRDMKHKFLELMNEKITEARKAYSKVIEEKVKYRFGHNEMERMKKDIPEIEIYNDAKNVYKPSMVSNNSESLYIAPAEPDGESPRIGRIKKISKVKI